MPPPQSKRYVLLFLIVQLVMVGEPESMYIPDPYFEPWFSMIMQLATVPSESMYIPAPESDLYPPVIVNPSRRDLWAPMTTFDILPCFPSASSVVTLLT